MMKLLPLDIADKIPELYDTEELGDDAIVHVKFFTPWSFWTWYVIEYDGRDLLWCVLRSWVKKGKTIVRIGMLVCKI